MRLLPASLYIGHTDRPTLVTRDQQVQVGARPLVESEGPEKQGLAAGRLALLLYFSSFPRRGRSVNWATEHSGPWRRRP